MTERFVRQGKIMTAAGVSAGIDMALALVSLEQGDEVAQVIQLIVEYDPQPPFDTGSREKASAALSHKARQFLAELYAPKAADQVGMPHAAQDTQGRV